MGVTTETDDSRDPDDFPAKEFFKKCPAREKVLKIFFKRLAIFLTGLFKIIDEKKFHKVALTLRSNFFLKNISQSIYRPAQTFLSHDRTPDFS